VNPEFWLEAEEYRTMERPDGVFEVVKEFDDGMDAFRYAFTMRPWYPRNAATPKQVVWEAHKAPNWEELEAMPAFQDYPSATGSMT
jgi:hypothetical protein